MDNEHGEAGPLWGDGAVVLLMFAAFLGLVTAMFGPPDMEGMAFLGALACAGLAGLARLGPVRRWRAARRG